MIRANGSELARTPVLKAGAAPVSIDVTLPQADVVKLSLHTIAARNSTPGHNLTVWGEPTLYR